MLKQYNVDVPKEHIQLFDLLKGSLKRLLGYVVRLKGIIN